MTAKERAGGQAEEKNIIWRDVTALILDPQNPRLILPPDASQDQILRQLFQAEALEELALSLARNGYFSEEPVVVVPHEDEGTFVVVEGNRRLATLKILLEAKLRKRVGASDWPELPPERAAKLARIPTVSYDSREEVVPYLGFRHITGIKTWDPFAKARYVSDLINSGRALAEVEEAIGDSARTAKKLYQSYVVYNQIVADLSMDGTPIRKNFSLLEVLLSQQPVKRHLGVPRELPAAKTEEVVPDDKLEALREAVSWVFGDPERGQERILTDSRQISRQLAPILADPEALEHLRKTRDIDAAYEYSGGEQQYLMRQLQSSRRAAQRALGVIPLHREDAEVVAESDRLHQIVDAIIGEVRKK